MEREKTYGEPGESEGKMRKRKAFGIYTEAAKDGSTWE
jgi:hypothetical protein